MRLILLVICGFAALTLSAVAGPFEDGVSAADRGDPATALKIFRPLAEQGDARAQDSLGYMYESAWGVQQDYVLAVVWWRKAADQGNASAQFSLGTMYARGYGVPQADI